MKPVQIYFDDAELAALDAEVSRLCGGKAAHVTRATRGTVVREAVRCHLAQAVRPQSGAPDWARTAARAGKVDAEELAAVIVRCIEAVQAKEVDPRRAKTAAVPILKLWKALGRPPLVEFELDFRVVARAAHFCSHGLFAKDIRAEGWKDGIDRQYDVATISRQSRWDERLAVAREWHTLPAPELQRPQGLEGWQKDVLNLASKLPDLPPANWAVERLFELSSVDDPIDVYTELEVIEQEMIRRFKTFVGGPEGRDLRSRYLALMRQSTDYDPVSWERLVEACKNSATLRNEAGAVFVQLLRSMGVPELKVEP